MAVLFIDGFDKYGPTGFSGTALNSLLTAGEWTSISGSQLSTLSIVDSLSGASGNALKFTGEAGFGGNNSTFLSRTTGSVSRYIGGCRVKLLDVGASTRSPFMIQTVKSSTAQWSLTVNTTTALLSLRTGADNGTALVTNSTALSVGTVHYLEWDITVGASGAYQVWLDGVSQFSGTGNTRGDGANNNADLIQLGLFNTGNNVLGFIVDDFYLFDSTGGANNAVCLDDPRVETDFATGDSQTQFSYGAGYIGTPYSASSSTNAPGANQLFLRKFTAEVSTTLNSVSILPAATSVSAKFKAVLYPDSGGTPAGQSLTATGGEIVGCTSGTTLTSTFGSPPSLTGGNSYWIGFITDTSIALTQTDANTTGVKAANTYVSGAPATCPAITTGQVNWELWGNLTGGSTNWSTSNKTPPPGDLSYASSSTVSNEDLYSFPALTSPSPTTIHTVAVKAYVKKTDAGARTADLRTKSGTTDSGGSATGIAIPTTYAFITSYFDTDPNTGIAWTATGLNSALHGPKVAS